MYGKYTKTTERRRPVNSDEPIIWVRHEDEEDAVERKLERLEKGEPILRPNRDL